jgi:exodeoxyribonuclease VIII
METGIFGMSYEKYAAIDAIGRHHLEKDPTWRHAQYRLSTPRKDSAAPALGRIVHCAVLEPDELAARYHVVPHYDMRTKEGKARWAEDVAAAAGKTLVRGHDYAPIVAEIRAHRKADSLFSDGTPEPSCFWTINGLFCKVRLDYWKKPRRIITELKTARSASPPVFAKEIFARKYHIQLAWQRMGLQSNGETVDEAWIVAAETAPPYCVAAYKLDAHLLDITEELIHARLDEYLKHAKRGHFPGYPEVSEIGIPAWGLEQIEQEVYGSADY